ncbi:MAG: hypothetical protein F4Z43_09530, partial [Rhodothermaceae bacterium]|nr:hypothetical protein [Rhodothermaceae bacterium]
MRVLLDTNILIHRESRTVVRDDIGRLFRWLDQLNYKKIIHPNSVSEIERHSDPKVVYTFHRKLSSYRMLKTTAPDTQGIASLREGDKTENDRIDTSMLAELASDRVDLLITEDRGIHSKATIIGLDSRVFTIDGFLEKVTAENPKLAEYGVLSVKTKLFGHIDVQQRFFDSFREDYPNFDGWFNRKADETAYVCQSDSGEIVAFLYIKREQEGEDYSDIIPPFQSDQRLKIGTLKVVSNGYKLGERFLKIVFDNALLLRVSEIYVTVFNKTADQFRLIRFLEDWGFILYGSKGNSQECVYVRDFRPRFDTSDPRKTYPYISNSTRAFIVPIYPKYHTELLPDSILQTESPQDYSDNKPNRNAISKVYVSRSVERDLSTGDIIVFYRTKWGGPAFYTSVATTIGIVQDVKTTIPHEKAFLEICRKRSVFTDAQLLEQWNYDPSNRPFTVNFLSVYSLPKRPNLKELMEEGVINEAPRGFEQLSARSFQRL